MKILSIDVGIKNLAFCIIETRPDLTYKILKWDVINLCGQEPTCGFTTKKGICGHKAKYHKNNSFYCRIHSKKSEFLVPTSELAKVKLKRTKISTLIEITNKHNIIIDKSLTKPQIMEGITKYMDQHMLDQVTTQSANDMSLVTIGIAIKKQLNEYICTEDIDHVIIENQISPIANRMKSIQGMLMQYFIMKDITNITFVSSANKLKQFIGNKKTSYAERKKIGIDVTIDILATSVFNTDWIPIVSTHKKKDDLADSFLQGLWFLNNKKLIEIKYNIAL